VSTSEIPIVPSEIDKLQRFQEHAGMLKWLASVDHKQIAVMYMLTSPLDALAVSAT
jgi:hypothetical protein